jgi:hypothetical protein
MAYLRLKNTVQTHIKIGYFVTLQMQRPPTDLFVIYLETLDEADFIEDYRVSESRAFREIEVLNEELDEWTYSAEDLFDQVRSSAFVYRDEDELVLTDYRVNQHQRDPKEIRDAVEEFFGLEDEDKKLEKNPAV